MLCVSSMSMTTTLLPHTPLSLSTRRSSSSQQALPNCSTRRSFCPLMIGYYTVLVWSYVGWTGPLAIYLFFSVGTLGGALPHLPHAPLSWHSRRSWRATFEWHMSGECRVFLRSLTSWRFRKTMCVQIAAISCVQKRRLSGGICNTVSEATKAEGSFGVSR